MKAEMSKAVENRANKVTVDNIQKLVNDFYDKAKKHNILGPLFESIMTHGWDQHMEVMYVFWESQLLRNKKYTGTFFPMHAKMPLKKEHFDIWLELFDETVDEIFEDDPAERAKHVAGAFVRSFKRKF